VVRSLNHSDASGIFYDLDLLNPKVLFSRIASAIYISLEILLV
jgi:hypothetical protein